jgi:hypothetical protein
LPSELDELPTRFINALSVLLRICRLSLAHTAAMKFLYLEKVGEKKLQLDYQFLLAAKFHC